MWSSEADFNFISLGLIVVMMQKRKLPFQYKRIEFKQCGNFENKSIDFKTENGMRMMMMMMRESERNTHHCHLM